MSTVSHQPQKATVHCVYLSPSTNMSSLSGILTLPMTDTSWHAYKAPNKRAFAQRRRLKAWAQTAWRRAAYLHAVDNRPALLIVAAPGARPSCSRSLPPGQNPLTNSRRRIAFTKQHAPPCQTGGVFAIRSAKG